MELSKRPGLVAYATQHGATFTSFDEVRCRSEVVGPARELLESKAVEFIVFVIVCDPNVTHGEERKLEHLDQEPPPKPVTPTSNFLIKEMRAERSEWLFDYLNVDVWGNQPDSIRNHAVSYAMEQSDAVLVCPPEAPFPTVEDVRTAVSELQRGQVLDLVPATAEL